MRAIDWVALSVCFCIFSSVAFAHAAHVQTAPVAAGAPPSTGAHQVLGAKVDGITFISLTSDPLRDYPAVLKACTLKQGVDGPHWFFLAGDKAQMDLVCNRIGQIVPTPGQHSTQLIVGDVANERWSEVRPDAPAVAQRLQLLTMSVAER